MADKPDFWGDPTGGGATPVGKKDFWGEGSATPAKAKKKSGGGGFLGTLSRIPGDFVQGADRFANEFIPGMAAIGEGVYHDAVHRSEPSKLAPIAKASAIGTVETVKHPLRDPFSTALLLLPVYGAGARGVVAVSRGVAAARAGEGAAAVAKTLAKKPDLGKRVITVPGSKSALAKELAAKVKSGELTGEEAATRWADEAPLLEDATATGHFSRSTGSAVFQRARDKSKQKRAGVATEAGKVSGPIGGGIGNLRLVGVTARANRAVNRLDSRAKKWNARQLDILKARDRAAGTRLAVIGANLSPAQWAALRIAAEQVPVDELVAARQSRLARAQAAGDTAEVARHQERLDAQEGAREFLDESSGKPVISDPQLQEVWDQLVKVSGGREGILRDLGLMESAAEHAAKTKQARSAAGATMVEGTSPGIFAEVGDNVRIGAQQTAGKVTAVRNGVATVWYARFSRAEDVPLTALTIVEKPRLTGAEHVVVGPDAPFIGSAVERHRVRGTPRVSGGVLGHTASPGSLKEFTGAAREHGLERQDVTNVVAERFFEAVRLSQLARLVDLVKGAGTNLPTRANDVFLWTDKTVSRERVDPAVRQQLNDPEGLAGMEPHEQLGLLEKVRQSMIEDDFRVHPGREAALIEAAAAGKGVFVRRRLLGDAAEAHTGLDPTSKLGRTVHGVDVLNNAQKIALIYAKPSYLIAQGISNAAMIVIQNIANPQVLYQAAKLDRALSPAQRAIVDDMQGQGAVLTAMLEGRGLTANAANAVAHSMSRRVDTPARRAAWYSEAIRRGIDTPEKFDDLLTNDARAQDLAEITQKGREALVDYGELSNAEQKVVKRIIFVYPWVKGSTKYAAHFFRDHPVQAAAVNQLGIIGQESADRQLGDRPSYYKGLIPFGERASNPAALNFFQTPAQLGSAAVGLATLDPRAAQASQFFTPAAALAVALATGRDSLGRPLKGADEWWATLPKIARDTQVSGIPAVRAARAGLSDRSDLARRLLGPSPATKTFPDPNDAFWTWLFQAYPRRIDKPALHRGAAFEKLNR